MTRIATTAALVLFSAVSPLAAQRADLVVYGRVWTGDSTLPAAEAVAVRQGRILARGARPAMRRHLRRGTRGRDNGRGLLRPGVRESHTHLLGGGGQPATP